MTSVNVACLNTENYPRQPTRADHDRCRHATTLVTLLRTLYGSVLEMGCGAGVMTQSLAARCDRLLAVDSDAALLEQARIRMAGSPHVQFTSRSFHPEAGCEVAGYEQDAAFDLIMMVDILARLEENQIECAAKAASALAARGGHLHLVNTLAQQPGCRLSGNEAAERFVKALRPVAPVLLQLRTAEYRIDVLQL